MIGQRYQKAELQSTFYRNNFRRMVNALTFTVSTMVIMILVILYLILVKHTPHYYVMTDEGKIISLTKLKK